MSNRKICIHGVADARICVNCLNAEIGRLRTALERTRPHVRNEIIEECARVAENNLGRPATIPAAIRALKEGK